LNAGFYADSFFIKMRRTIYYIPPVVEALEVVVEEGFGSSNGDFGIPEWDII